jgi:aminopeptidase YwaD
MNTSLRTAVAVAVLSTANAAAQRVTPVPLIAERTVSALADELSGSAARRNLEFIARQNRVRASQQFRVAADFIASELRRYGLSEVTMNEIPADGHTMYGTQKARPAWDPEFAELWEVRAQGATTVPVRRVASFEDEPVVLAEDSDSGEVTAEVIDVGAGSSERDYAGRNVRGKLVLISAQPGAAAPLAVDKFGAAGMISYAPNQVTAWWKEDENLIRWGHLDSFSPRRTFAFMLSLRQARALQERLGRGEHITLHATVRASRHPGVYSIVTAALPGGDPTLRNEEIVFSCHLDHQRPGANDNASGCATNLEIARTLAKLVREGKLARPARTIRFVWPAEVEGTMALFHFRPELRARFRAAIHMDMVGGGPVTKAVFHVTRGPLSLPTFVNDVGQTIGAYVNAESYAFAAGEGGAYAFVSPDGGREALQADMAEFTMGSDHEIYTEGSFRIPAIYMNDWPDRYIHTNFDAPANIDPTKLQRAAFIGAASALFLADLRTGDVPALWGAMKSAVLRRAATVLERRARLPAVDGAVLVRTCLATERAAFMSISGFAAIPSDVQRDADAFFTRLEAMLGPVDAQPPATGDAAVVFERNPAITGPMTVFGYDYLDDHFKGPSPKLLAYEGLRGAGGEYTYEVLNLVDGKRQARDIRDVVSAEYGPVAIDFVVEYLKALESAGVVRRRP